MPFVRTTTSKKMSDCDKNTIKDGLGRLLNEILSKQEKWLMTAFADETPMTFGGDGENDSVFVEVSIFGTAADEAYDRLTAELCELYSSTLGISPERIYVKYEESSRWGWNGANF